ncbi:MAG: WD40-repeat-containing domain protein [Benniella sp.]|nr:MAG: WD40-repeat-containing domain protein [Benniella sp.]
MSEEWNKEDVSIAYSPRGDQIAFGNLDDSDLSVEIWNILTGECEHMLCGHRHHVTDIAYSPQGDQVASASWDETVKLWDVETGDCLHTLTGHTHWIESIAYSPDGSQIASGSGDSTVRLWDVKTGKCNHMPLKHDGRITKVVYAPQGDRVVSSYGSGGKCSQLWNVVHEPGDCPSAISTGIHTDHLFVYSPKGDQVASTEDCDILLWDVKTEKHLYTLAGHLERVSNLVYSPQGDLVASVGLDDNIVRLWDAETGVCLRLLAGHSKDICSMVFSPKGDRIISGSEDKMVRIWEVGVRTSQRTSSSHIGDVNLIKCSPKGDQVASCSSGDVTVRLWNMGTGSCQHILRGHSEEINCIAYSPEGDQIATGSDDGTVRLWDTETGSCTHTFVHWDRVNKIVYSPQKDRLATFSDDDDTVLLWNMLSGECRDSLQLWASKGHTEKITGIVYSSHGDLIVTASNDQTVRLWDAVSGQCRAVIQDFQHQVRDIAWLDTPNAQYVVAGCGDGVVGMWQVIMDEDQCQVRLHWKTTNGMFDVQDATIQGVKGLDSVNKSILKQSRAVGEPAHRQREGSKEKAIMAPVVSRFKDRSDWTEEIPNGLIHLPAKRLFEFDEDDEGVAKRTCGNDRVSNIEE